MKTTIDLPDALVRRIKVRAAEEGRTVKDLVADLLGRELGGAAVRDPAAILRRVRELRGRHRPLAPGPTVDELLAEERAR